MLCQEGRYDDHELDLTENIHYLNSLSQWGFLIIFGHFIHAYLASLK